MNNQNNPSILSELKMDHIVFDNLSFIRKGFKPETEAEAKLELGVSVGKIRDGQYRVSLNVSVDQKDEYNAEVQISGFCSIQEDFPIKQEILEKNVVAILFPYVRAQLTLLTSQPETTPLLLPAINIDALINQASEQVNQE